MSDRKLAAHQMLPQGLLIIAPSRMLILPTQLLMLGIQAVEQACNLCNRPTPLLWFDKEFNKEIFGENEDNQESRFSLYAASTSYLQY